jgi:hypothetical protein
MDVPVWASTADAPPPVSDKDGFGDGWVYVGVVPSREREFWKYVSGRISDRAVAFYLDSPRDGGAEVPQEFWLGIDVYGDGRKRLVTRRRAQRWTLERRPPEPHPGLIGPAAVPVGVRIVIDDLGMFTEPEVA